MTTIVSRAATMGFVLTHEEFQWYILQDPTLNHGPDRGELIVRLLMVGQYSLTLRCLHHGTIILTLLAVRHQ